MLCYAILHYAIIYKCYDLRTTVYYVISPPLRRESGVEPWLQTSNGVNTNVGPLQK